MKVITSKDNSIYKQTVRLLRKKFRDETGLYLLEGRKPLHDALESGLMIEKIFACIGEELPDWIPEGKCVRLEPKLFTALSGTVSSQGIVSVVRRKEWDIPAFAETVGGGRIVVLDRLQDPGNAGTIIRTAEAAGFDGIVAVRGTTDLYAPKVVRSAAGSLMRMPVLTDVSAEDVIRMAQERWMKLIVTVPDGITDCFKADLTGAAALVIGNEGNGISEEFIAAADLKACIPMEGGIESLNASVAAGIMMYCIKNSEV